MNRSVGGHLGPSYIMAVANSAAINKHARLEKRPSVLWGTCLGLDPRALNGNSV